MNFRRKSTIGFSIGNILLDLLGGLTNYGQMAVQSIDQSEFLFHQLTNFAEKNEQLASELILMYTWFTHLSRFVGKLLWKYREDIAIFGELFIVERCCQVIHQYCTNILHLFC